MIVHTTTNPKGRRIVRAVRDTKDLHYGYTLSGRIPSLSVSLDGSDGKTYTLHLDDGDVKAIVAARARYAEHFEGK